MTVIKHVELIAVLTLLLCSCSGGGGGQSSEADEFTAPPAVESVSSDAAAEDVGEVTPPAVNPVVDVPAAEVPVGNPGAAVDDEAAGETVADNDTDTVVPAAGEPAGNDNSAEEEPPASGDIPVGTVPVAFDPQQAEIQVANAVKDSIGILNQVAPDMLVRDDDGAKSLTRTVALADVVEVYCSDSGTAAVNGSATVTLNDEGRLFSFSFAGTLADCHGLSGSISAEATGAVQAEIVDESAAINLDLTKGFCSLVSDNLEQEVTMSLAQGSVGGTISGQLSAACGALIITCSWNNADFQDVDALQRGCSY